MTRLIARVLVIAITGLAAVPAAAQQGVRQTDGGIMIDFPNTDMRLVVAALSEAAGLNVTWADIPQRTVTLRTSTPVPASQVRTYLESLLRANQMELRDEGGGLLRIVSTAAPQGPAPGAQPAYEPGGTLGGGGAMAIFVHPLRHAPAEDVARSIGALFGIGDGAYGGAERPRSLTDELRGQAIDLNGNRVQPQERPSQGLNAQLSGQVAIFPDQRTNSLLIRASQADYQVLAAAITQLDTRPLQVLIEVVIAEVRRDRQFGLGVDFRVADQEVDGSDVVIGGELAGASAGDVVLRIMRLGAVDANVVLRALSASGDVNILSRPVILAQNNEEARIMVGDQRPFIQISRALPTDNAARDEVIQYRDVGTRLTIRPTINPDGYVTLTVLQEVSTATDITQFGAPVISTREAETRLLVKDGHTVVIGGLIDETRTSTRSGIPVLKDIPLLGNLFRSTTRRTNTSELFLFLIPHVLYSDDDVDGATQRVRERAPALDRALPDSIPLYWDIRRDTLGAPPQPQSGPPSGGPRDPGLEELSVDADDGGRADAPHASFAPASTQVVKVVDGDPRMLRPSGTPPPAASGEVVKVVDGGRSAERMNSPQRPHEVRLRGLSCTGGVPRGVGRSPGQLKPCSATRVSAETGLMAVPAAALAAQAGGRPEQHGPAVQRIADGRRMGGPLASAAPAASIVVKVVDVDQSMAGCADSRLSSRPADAGMEGG